MVGLQHIHLNIPPQSQNGCNLINENIENYMNNTNNIIDDNMMKLIKEFLTNERKKFEASLHYKLILLNPLIYFHPYQ